MIEVKELRKSYKTGDFVQKALDGVSLTFRDNEFVAVLGPSGSGKTTLLNILGGLDHADSGDIVINGVSTKDYKSADWDTYRNHRIGFIFQSYNLIPHQSILSNVELALTLAGVSKRERTERAKEALERVGLGDHVHKKPAQLSGGQMQRVAIARALVNDPNIVLADEPTGALDTETGIAVMNLLQEIANDRLVIMVTHNPELAEQYATRIVRLADGQITHDTDPLPTTEAESPKVVKQSDGSRLGADSATTAGVDVFAGTIANTSTSSEAQPRVEIEQSSISQSNLMSASEAHEEKAPVGLSTNSESAVPKNISADAVAPSAPKRRRRARMSFLTALGLSFNNLMTKKGRTFMTAFAGSIGIIGIAAILSLSNGVNNYIADTEEAALTSYPLTITKSSFDISSLLTSSMGFGDSDEEDLTPMEKIQAAQEEAENPEKTAVHETDLIPEISIMTDMFGRVKNNDLSAFKEYLDDPSNGLEPYINTVHYAYGITPYVYVPDTSDGVVQLNPSSMQGTFSNGINSSSALLGGSMSFGVFERMLDNEDLIKKQYDLVLGDWPENYDEALLVLSSSGRLTDYTLYSIGYYDPDIMDEMTQAALNGDEVVAPETAQDFSYEDALGMHFAVVPAFARYEYNAEQKVWTDVSRDEEKMKQIIANDAIDLHIVGVIQPNGDSASSLLSQGVAYTGALTYKLMDMATESSIVRQQMANEDTDVFTGKTFEELQNDEANEFDLGSMFQVDEEALQNAFSMDTSALESLGNLGGMDFSGFDLDMGSLDFSDMMSGMDLGDLDLDTSALAGVISEDTLRQIMADAPQFDPTSLLPAEGEDAGLDDEQRQQLADATNQLAAGFISWAITGGHISFTPGGDQPDFAALFTQYLEEDETAAAQVEALSVLAGDTVGSRIADALQNYTTNQLAPYLQQAFTNLMMQAAGVMANQMASALTTQLQAATAQMGGQISSALSSAVSGGLGNQMQLLSDSLSSGFSFDAQAFADAIQVNMDQDDLTSLLTNYMNADELTFDGNMSKLGYAERDKPQSISIYPVDFPAKEQVLRGIDTYNAKQEAAGNNDATIQYSDIAGTLMSSVTDIVDTISLVLIAFVSISLVVSSIMIGIITYISVLERKKEIGILRAMGASKQNIANVFNAETVIEGLISGVFAIALVMAVSVPVNAIVEAGWDVPNVMSLPWESALILIALSVGLTFIAGLMPSQAAARRDPVEALRSE